MSETWKDITEYEGVYQISNLGRVKSLSRYKNGIHGKHMTKEKILKRLINKGGYSYIVLNYKKNRKHMLVHRLVVCEFLENKFNKKYVNHKDGNKINNDIKNLEWVTASENSSHAFRLGLRKPTLGLINGMAKFSENEILLIREMFENKQLIEDGHSICINKKEVAKIFGTTHKYIDSILKRRVWKHI